jgi:16S rRNA processing protein RimM
VSNSPTQLLVIGRVSRPHGIAGELKVQLGPEYAGALQSVRRVYLDGDAQPYRVLGYREHQGAALLKLDRVATRNDAEALRGARVAIHVSDLPELPAGSFYTHQLVGLRVLRHTGEPLGQLSEVLATGSNDVYVVKTPAGELLLPALESVIVAVDLVAGTMHVAVPDGLE